MMSACSYWPWQNINSRTLATSSFTLAALDLQNIQTGTLTHDQDNLWSAVLPALLFTAVSTPPFRAPLCTSQPEKILEKEVE